jgi:hypothetical protein
MRTTQLFSLAIVVAQLLLLSLPALGYAPPLELFGFLAFCVLGYGVSLARDWRVERVSATLAVLTAATRGGHGGRALPRPGEAAPAPGGAREAPRE